MKELSSPSPVRPGRWRETGTGRTTKVTSEIQLVEAIPDGAADGKHRIYFRSAKLQSEKTGQPQPADTGLEGILDRASKAKVAIDVRGDERGNLVDLKPDFTPLKSGPDVPPV